MPPILFEVPEGIVRLPDYAITYSTDPEIGRLCQSHHPRYQGPCHTR